MIFTNLRRHRVRTAIGATGIALGVATMLSVVGLLGGAVKMFERILRSDSEMVVFEKNVSDLFFSNVAGGGGGGTGETTVREGGAAGACSPSSPRRTGRWSRVSASVRPTAG